MPQGLEKTLEEIENKLILKALQEAEGQKSKAAKILNLPLSSFYYKLEKYGLNP
jgi:DNA-binding NtrC family response regulator